MFRECQSRVCFLKVLMQDFPWYKGGPSRSSRALAQIKGMVERCCHSWEFQERPDLGQRQHGHARYDFVAMLLVYIREFPQFVPHLKSAKQLKNQDVFIGWVKLCEIVTIPKFRRRLLGKKGTQETICEKRSEGGNRRRLCASLLQHSDVFVMLQHPRFGIDWLEASSNDGRNNRHEEKVASDRNDFRQRLSDLRLKLPSDTAAAQTRVPSPTGAINGDKTQPEDPFLNFDIENTNYDACVVSASLKVNIMRVWVTKAVRARFHAAVSAVVFENLASSRPVEKIDFSPFMPIEETRKPPTVSIMGVDAIQGVSNLPETVEISFVVSCHDREQADGVLAVLTNENICIQLLRFQLPKCQLTAPSVSNVFDLDLLGMCEAGPISLEAQVCLSFFVAICCCAAFLAPLKVCTKQHDRSVVALTRQSKHIRLLSALSWTSNSALINLMTGLHLAWCYQRTFPLLFAAPRTRSCPCPCPPLSPFPPLFHPFVLT